MADKTEKIMKALLGDKADKLTGKMDAVNDIINSQQAQELKNKIDPAAMQKALENGDGEALKAFIKKVVSTKEGQELAKKFGGILD